MNEQREAIQSRNMSVMNKAKKTTTNGSNESKYKISPIQPKELGTIENEQLSLKQQMQNEKLEEISATYSKH